MITEAGLVLTAETHHRSVILQAHPLEMRKVFTLREFGRLGKALGPLADTESVDSLLRRVEEVAACRGFAEAPSAGDDDIQDPMGASLETARLRAADISSAVDAVIRALGLGVTT
jgi:protein-tyrosine phosphatase